MTMRHTQQEQLTYHSLPLQQNSGPALGIIPIISAVGGIAAGILNKPKIPHAPSPPQLSTAITRPQSFMSSTQGDYNSTLTSNPLATTGSGGQKTLLGQ